MQPTPPWALKPSAEASSPESWMKSLPQVARCSETRSTLPVASLTPTMFLKSCASWPIVSGRHVDHRARRDVVDDDRQLGCLGDGGEMRIEAALRRLVVIGRDDESRIGARLLGILHQPDRLFGVVGAGAGDDRHAPLATSMHTLTTWRCSSCDSVGDSPVVPTGTSPVVPSAICHSTNARKAFSSKRPLFSNGVTSAVSEPLSMSSNSLGLIEFCRSVYSARLLAESEAAHHSLDIVARQALPWCQRAQFERPRQPFIHVLFTT